MRKPETPEFQVDNHQVVLLRAGAWHQFRYGLLSLLAWVVAIFDFDASGDAPSPPYVVAVREKEGGVVLYSEGVYYGDEAVSVAQDFAKTIERVGCDDFVYKKSHGWRID